ncbi:MULTISPECIES: VNG_1110C family protein [Halobacterium]|jgi:hypothetical protein|uniref:VNG_1110C family protein n=1 Tax=Halobacterium TaxID=2239 RepID=UPI001E2DFACB|nr:MULTISPECIES: hypothetical protein [Halobacterium]MCD2199468.1 hypothetical protein [Halobacterium sp. KA-4]MCD2204442.1 hypothetical protein [Halobacterium sp. KA-6]UHH26721.1 hypothetical protein LT974_07270 [Halobacterium noricense]
MPDPSSLRDSTQIVLPVSTVEGYREDIDEKFTVSFLEHEEMVRIIGSPVVIKNVSEYLARQGVNVP